MVTRDILRRNNIVDPLPTTVFATLALPGERESAIRLLAASLRRFGGAMARSPLLLLTPNEVQDFAAATRATLEGLQVQWLKFPAPSQAAGFPFASKVQAAAWAETLLVGQSSLLVWMDVDTLFLQEPAEFALPAGKQLGCCPVHHRLVGSPWEQPVDAFWSEVYRACGVSDERLFPVFTAVGDERIRAYFNAGLLVVRPEQGLLQAWKARFLNLISRAEFKPFFQQNPLYRIFFHQAVLAGVLLSRFRQEEIQLFSTGYNFPLHLLDHLPPANRPAMLDVLITCRYETFFQNPDWLQSLPASPALAQWVIEQLGEA